MFIRTLLDGQSATVAAAEANLFAAQAIKLVGATPQ
jgi:hypothetical protein